jgi:hypothetical protein
VQPVGKEAIMDEFADLFSSELATRVYLIVSLLFVLLYVAGFLLLRGLAFPRNRRPIISQHVVPGFGAALVAGAIGFGLLSAIIGKTPLPRVQSAVTISPEELQRQIDMNTLPILRVDNPI